MNIDMSGGYIDKKIEHYLHVPSFLDSTSPVLNLLRIRIYSGISIVVRQLNLRIQAYKYSM
jgi:hypothetical protein